MTLNAEFRSRPDGSYERFVLGRGWVQVTAPVDQADRVEIHGQAIVGSLKLWVDDARSVPLSVALDRLGGEMDAMHDLLAEKLRKLHAA